MNNLTTQAVDNVSFAFTALVQADTHMETYFNTMLQHEVSLEAASRLYNLILIACGRKIMVFDGVSPAMPEHYLVPNLPNIKFSGCPIYAKIMQHIATLNKDTITVLGMISCEMQAFNYCLNELDKQHADWTFEKKVQKIELLPPELPC